MSMTFQEQRKKKIKQYRKERKYISDMKSDEVEFEYVEAKSRYEHDKSILAIMMITILLSVFMDIWKTFFQSIEKVVQFVTSQQENTAEVARVLFVSVTVAFIMVSFMFFCILITHMRKMSKTYKRLIMIEEILNEKKKK